MKRIKFTRVEPTNEQIKLLYDLLEARKFNISNRTEALYESHETFVKTNPYRDWFIVNLNDRPVGSFYIQNDNSIGINLSEEEDYHLVRDIVEFVREVRTIGAIPSVRYGGFFINVPYKNSMLAAALQEIGATATQVSFVLPPEIA